MAESNEPNKSSKKFPPLYFIILAIVAVIVGMILIAKSLSNDVATTFAPKEEPSKSAPVKVVASNAQPAVSTPASTVKTTTPATGEGSTAKIEVKSEGGKLKVDFDPCCNCKPAPAPSKASKKAQHKHAPVVASAPAETAPAPKNATFWGWVHHESSENNPKVCYADRRITGKPARCSSVLVEPASAGETEDAWRTRVAGYAGIKVGTKDDKGTISSVRNEDVVVR